MRAAGDSPAPPEPVSGGAPAPRGPEATAPSTLRAWVIGLLLIPPLVFAVEYTEIVTEGPDLAALSLPITAVFALLVLVPLNLWVKRRRPAAALTQAELLMIYSMNVVAAYLSGLGMIQFLAPSLVGWRYFATPENKWDNWFRFVRPWAVPDPAVVPGFYAGRASFFSPAILTGWAGAIGVWTGFLLTLLLCSLCLATLLRRQWVENERMSFPIAQIPLAITDGGGDSPLWSSRVFWGGAALAAALEAAAALHNTLVPTFPCLPIKFDEPALRLDAGLTSPPWNAVGGASAAFYPFVIGMGFLVPLDVSFSCWFFYLLGKAENVAAAALGLRGAGGAGVPYADAQCVGAFVGLGLFSLWLARRHLGAAWRRAFLRPGDSGAGDSGAGDADEPLTYRAAFLGLIGGLALLIGFGAALGLSLWVSALFFSLLLILIVALTRIRAEAGLPWAEGPNTLVHQSLIDFGGTQAFSARELTGFAFLRWADATWRGAALPAQLEALKMGGAASPRPLNPRHFAAALMAAGLVGILAAWASFLGIYYHYGAASAHVNGWRTGQGHFGFDDLQYALNNPTAADWPRLGWGAAGAAAVVALFLLRARFAWWPLHPVGYAAAGMDVIKAVWFPLLLSWLVKSLILRYGGVRLYRQALPFFFGLFLGDYAASAALALLSLVTGHATYRTFPS